MLALNLTACVLASIYTGAITTWSDSQIRALNPNLNVPAGQPIKVSARGRNSESEGRGPAGLSAF